MTFLFGIQLLGLVTIWLPLLLIILSVLSLSVFWHVEKDGANPVIPVELFQNRAMRRLFTLCSGLWFLHRGQHLPADVGPGPAGHQRLAGWHYPDP